MKRQVLFIAAAVCLLATANIHAQLTFTETGPHDSDGATFTGTNATAGGLFSTITFSGDLTEVDTGTFGSEARFRAGAAEYQVTTTGGFTGTLNIVNEVTTGVFFAPATAGAISIDTFESFDDGADGVADATWDNIDFALNGSVNALNLGTFVMGNPFVFDTEGSAFDTELGGFDSIGNLLGNDDDGGTGTLSLFDFDAANGAPLAVGDYVLVMGAFNTLYADGSATTTSTTTGNYNINLNGVSVDAGTLEAGGLRTITFTVVAVPEPSTLSLFAVAGLGLFVRRKRS